MRSSKVPDSNAPRSPDPVDAISDSSGELSDCDLRQLSFSSRNLPEETPDLSVARLPILPEVPELKVSIRTPEQEFYDTGILRRKVLEWELSILTHPETQRVLEDRLENGSSRFRNWGTSASDFLREFIEASRNLTEVMDSVYRNVPDLPGDQSLGPNRAVKQVWARRSEVFEAGAKIPLYTEFPLHFADLRTIAQSLQEIDQEKAEEAEQLWKNLQGDVKHNFTSVLRLALSTARDTPVPGLRLGERFSAVVAEIPDALVRYRPESGNRLTTYIKFRMKRALRPRERRQGEFVNIPTRTVAERAEIMRTIDAMELTPEEALGPYRDRLREKLYARGNINPSRVQGALQEFLSGPRIIHLDSQMNDGEVEEGILQRSPDHADSVHTLVERSELQGVAKVLLSALAAREKLVIEHRFGLNGKRPSTLREVGAKFDPPLTAERIRQIQKSALMKLRNPRVWKLNLTGGKHDRVMHSEIDRWLEELEGGRA